MAQGDPPAGCQFSGLSNGSSILTGLLRHREEPVPRAPPRAWGSARGLPVSALWVQRRPERSVVFAGEGAGAALPGDGVAGAGAGAGTVEDNVGKGSGISKQWGRSQGTRWVRGVEAWGSLGDMGPMGCGQGTEQVRDPSKGPDLAGAQGRLPWSCHLASWESLPWGLRRPCCPLAVSPWAQGDSLPPGPNGDLPRHLGLWSQGRLAGGGQTGV